MREVAGGEGEVRVRAVAGPGASPQCLKRCVARRAVDVAIVGAEMASAVLRVVRTRKHPRLPAARPGRRMDADLPRRDVGVRVGPSTPAKKTCGFALIARRRSGRPESHRASAARHPDAVRPRVRRVVERDRPVLRILPRLLRKIDMRVRLPRVRLSRREKETERAHRASKTELRTTRRTRHEKPPQETKNELETHSEPEQTHERDARVDRVGANTAGKEARAHGQTPGFGASRRSARRSFRSASRPCRNSCRPSGIDDAHASLAELGPDRVVRRCAPAAPRASRR